MPLKVPHWIGRTVMPLTRLRDVPGSNPGRGSTILTQNFQNDYRTVCRSTQLNLSNCQQPTQPNDQLPKPVLEN